MMLALLDTIYLQVFGPNSGFHMLHCVSIIQYVYSLGRLLPEELELFYDSWRNIVTMNKHAQTVAAYKSIEVI